MAATHSGPLPSHGRLTFPAPNFELAISADRDVVPEQRGNQNALDLLLWATRILAAPGAGDVDSDTDVGNPSVVNAFRAAAYTARCTACWADAPALTRCCATGEHRASSHRQRILSRRLGQLT